MKRFLSKSISLALALMIGFSLAACGGGGASAPPPAESKAAESQTGGAEPAATGGDNDIAGEIVFWSWSESETKGLAAKFNEVYPNIKVKFVPVDSSNFLTKFQTALISNSELPDVCLQERTPRGAMYALDCWENLEKEPYNFDRSIVYPQILPVMTNERDEVVGIERELNPSGMIYKRDLAEKYLGTQDPDEVGAMIADWDKFIALGEKISKETNGEVKMLAGLRDMSSPMSAQYVDVIFDGKDVHATEFFTSIFDPMVRSVKGGIVGKENMYSPSWNSTFKDDATIFYPAAPWTAQWTLKPNDPDSEGRWGICTPPVRGYSWGGTAYGIPTDAKNKDLAWKFIEWATCTDEGTAACEEVVGAIVSREANYAGGFPSEPDPYFAGQSPNAYLMEKCNPTMEIRVMSQYDQFLDDVIALVTDMIYQDPNMTTEKAVSAAIDEMKNRLPADMNII